jgi:large subunit ribosomal protein L22
MLRSLTRSIASVISQNSTTGKFTLRTLSSSNTASTQSSTTTSVKPVKHVIEAGKRDIKQSPLKIKFLVSLIQQEWVPEALAQLKFSPKHRAEDIAKIVSRACALAKLSYGYIPEELFVKEVIVTKGLQMKRMRIMGRGRTGFGYKRQAHVLVKLEPIDFDSLINSSRNMHKRGMWIKRKAIADTKKLEMKTTLTAVPTSSA